MRLCSAPNCKNKYHAKGYCNVHYYRINHHGHFDTIRYYAENPIENTRKIKAKYKTTEKGKAARKRELIAKIKSGKGKLDCANRRAYKLKRTPKWLTVEQKANIKEIYRNCAIGYEVDHIIPLRGKEVSGLHVPWNLQYLPAKENAIKGNKV